MIEVIPAIDIIEGRCVRLTQGDYGRKTVYGGNVPDIAKTYADTGARRLHIVDLDGARESFPKNLGVLEKAAASSGLDIQYGGGIKSDDALRSVFSAGASRAICGSVAVSQPELLRTWLSRYGSGRIILGADVKDGRIATHGWQKLAEITPVQLINMFAADGLSQALCTDISRDGMLTGPSVEFYRSLQDDFPGIDFTVSGGISSAADIYELDRAGLRSVVVGKAIYEGRIGMEEMELFFGKNS